MKNRKIAFAETLSRLLKEYNISQKELSEKTGHTEASISRYINGQRIPKATTVIAIAEALGVPADMLLYGESWRPNEKINNICEIEYKNGYFDALADVGDILKHYKAMPLIYRNILMNKLKELRAEH